MDEEIRQICNLYYKSNIIMRSSIQEFIFWQNDCFLDIFSKPVVFNVLSLHKIQYTIKYGKMWIGNRRVYDINGEKPWNALSEYQEKYVINYNKGRHTLFYLLQQQKKEKQIPGYYQNDKYVYIRIERFDTVSEGNMGTIRNKMLIVDLRGNLGGDLNSMLRFLKKFVCGTMFYLQHKEEKYAVISKERAVDRSNKLYIIVDEKTASSAEIFALVLREKIGATIIGEPTYGKWIVHRIIQTGNFFVKVPQYGFVSSNGMKFKNYEGIVPDRSMDQVKINTFLQERIGSNYEQI